jgi:rfaE bifunctional protein nucleotidyltransferase chain/domain
MPKTRPITSTSKHEFPAALYPTKISNTLYAALLTHMWKRQGKKVILTNGVFDILHIGHVQFLEAAKARGDYLIVGINSDCAVKTLKGPNRPINHQEDRMAIVAALGCVDLVVLVNDVRVDTFIEIVRPTTWCKGSDYTADTLNHDETMAARRVKAEIALLNLVEGVSTTNVIAAIQRQSKTNGTQKCSRRKQTSTLSCQKRSVLPLR